MNRVLDDYSLPHNYANLGTLLSSTLIWVLLVMRSGHLPDVSFHYERP